MPQYLILSSCKTVATFAYLVSSDLPPSSSALELIDGADEYKVLGHTVPDTIERSDEDTYVVHVLPADFTPAPWDALQSLPGVVQQAMLREIYRLMFVPPGRDWDADMMDEIRDVFVDEGVGETEVMWGYWDGEQGQFLGGETYPSYLEAVKNMDSRLDVLVKPLTAD